MRIRQLNLTRYGRFTDFTIDLGERQANNSDFHIIFGENEAGKSTAFNAYLDLLFGIEERTKFNFLHEYSTLRVGAILEIEGTTIELARIKKRNANLLGINNQAIDEDILTSALHGLSREAYKAMFSLNDETLEKGGDEILASKGDFGRLLFSGTAGLSDLSEGIGLLKERANKIYSDRSSKCEIDALTQELKVVTEQRKSLDTLASTYGRLTEAHSTADNALQLARKTLDTIHTEHYSLQKLKIAFSIYADLIRLEKKLTLVNHLPDAPEGWIEEANNLQGKLRASEEKRDDAQFNIDNAKKELDNLVADPLITNIQGELATTVTLAAHDQKANEELPKLREDLQKVDANLSLLRQRLGADITTPLSDLVIPDDTIASLEELSQKEEQLTQRLYDASQETSDAKETLHQAIEDEKKAPLPNEKMTKLVALFDKYSEEDAQICLDQAELQLSQIRQKVQRELKKLAPWKGKQETLRSQVFPTSSQAQHWAKQHSTLSQELVTQKTQQKLCRIKQNKYKIKINTLLTQMGAISDANASKSRKTRDDAWAQHRRRLDDETADAFEKKLIIDDHICNERLAATDRLAQLRNEEMGLAEIGNELTIIDNEIIRIEKELDTLWKKIRSVFTKIGLPGDFEIEKLSPWLEQTQRIRDFIEEEDERCTELEKTRHQYNRQQATLLKALTNVGQKLPKNTLLTDIFAIAKPYKTQTIKSEERHLNAHKDVLKAEAQMQRRARALKSIEDEFDKWKKDWKRALENLWLKGKNASQIRALLTPLRKLAPLVSHQAELIKAIRTKENACRKFCDEVVKLVRFLGLDTQGDPKVQFLDLQTRFKNAQAIENARKVAARSQTDGEKQLAQSIMEISRIERRVKEMGQYFTLPEENASLDIVIQSLAQAKEKYELTNIVTEKEHQLLKELGIETRVDADIKLKNTTLADVETRLIKIEEELKTAGDELIKRSGESRDALRPIEAIGGDATVALLEERIQILLLEISNKANHALALHLGLMVAEQALMTYRDLHRSELLTHTSDAFKAITSGEFSHLVTQPSESGDRLIAVRSNGGSIAAEEMSKGTCFQLYLALRLAAYRRFCNLKGPLPFIGDDIMETADDRRAESIMRQLSEIAKNGQVIYFTHHNHLCEIAKHVFGKNVSIHKIPKIAIR